MAFLNLTEAQKRATEIVEFAQQKENWYTPGKSATVPGDDPRHILEDRGIKAVFSWTVTEKGVFRHMSASVPTPGKYPYPALVWTLAYLFGFTGAQADKQGVVSLPSRSWAFGENKEEGTIVVQEPVPQERWDKRSRHL